MALDLSLFNGSVSTLLDHLTHHYGEDAKLETYVICARVRSASVPGGSGINWIVNPGGEELAGGLLTAMLDPIDQQEPCETPVLYPGCLCCLRKASREENLR